MMAGNYVVQVGEAARITLDLDGDTAGVRRIIATFKCEDATLEMVGVPSRGTVTLFSPIIYAGIPHGAYKWVALEAEYAGGFRKEMVEQERLGDVLTVEDPQVRPPSVRERRWGDDG